MAPPASASTPELKDPDAPKQCPKPPRLFMWGYLPAYSPQRAPLHHPVPVPRSVADENWKSICPGGCGFALAISESGKLNTWGSTDDLGQSYIAAGKHQDRPEPFPLQTDTAIVQAAAGWAHCVAVTDRGEVHTWGWKECVPSTKSASDQTSCMLPSAENNYEGNIEGKDKGEEIQLKQYDHNENVDSSPSTSSETANKIKGSITPLGARLKVAPSMSLQPLPGSKAQLIKSMQKVANAGNLSGYDKMSDDGAKRRRLTAVDQLVSSDNLATNDENASAPPCLVALPLGVKIASVAAGGRHTLALSDSGQVWGWGYGGEGQLGLGSRIRTVSSPHPVPCIDSSSSYWQDMYSGKGANKGSDGQAVKVPGAFVKAVACGGRHSAVLTDAGALLTFGWGLYGQCGQGSTDDELSPYYVSSLGGLHIKGIAAGLWHTICITEAGDVYSFGGNQFGQLGTGGDQAEVFPKLIEASVLEGHQAISVSCGARHSAICTDTGKIFCWGWNKYGQLGLGDASDRNSPAEVKFDDCLAWNVACGWWHTLGLVTGK